MISTNDMARHRAMHARDLIIQCRGYGVYLWPTHGAIVAKGNPVSALPSSMVQDLAANWDDVSSFLGYLAVATPGDPGF